MAPYMVFDSSTCHFQILAACSEVLLLISQQKALMDVCGPVNGDEDVDTAAFDRSANMKDGARLRVVYHV